MKGYEMTQDELIKLAKQADMWGEDGSVFAEIMHAKVEAFAKLVERKVRQETIETIKDLTPRSGHKSPEYLFARKIINSVGQEGEELDVYTMQMLRQQGIDV